MPTETKFSPEQRAALTYVKELREAKGLPWSVKQSELAVAVAYAASVFDFTPSADEEKADAAAGPDKLPSRVKAFLKATADYGFLGNTSQLQQALGKLDKSDPLYWLRPKDGTSEYE